MNKVWIVSEEQCDYPYNIVGVYTDQEVAQAHRNELIEDHKRHFPTSVEWAHRMYDVVEVNLNVRERP